MSTRAPQYDAVIVGARPAGAATAMLLARRGHRVLVVDQERPGRDTLSTHALMRVGVDQLRRWDLLGHVVAAGTPPVREVTFHYADEPVTIPVDEPLYAPRRTVLDPIIVAGARAAGADVRYGVRVEGVTRAGDGRVTGVVARDRDGAPLHARARVTVGADGRTSPLARAVHAPLTRSAPSAGAVIYGYWSGVAASGYEWCFNHDRAGGLMPTNDGHVCVWVSAPAATMMEHLRGDRERAVHELLRQTTADVARRVRAGRRQSVLRGATNAVPNLTRRPWGAGWALVGDAGYHTDPLTAFGISAALRDAELLADALHVALTDPGRAAAALAAYERTRDDLGAGVFDATAAISTFAWDLPQVQRHHIALSAAMRQQTVALDARARDRAAVLGSR